MNQGVGNNSSMRLLGQVGSFSRVPFNQAAGSVCFKIPIPVLCFAVKL